VNNDGEYFPALTASYSNKSTPVNRANDGNYWYHDSPPNRWTTQGSPNEIDWLELNFGIERPIEKVKIYLLDDERGVKSPAKYDLEYWDGKNWTPVPQQFRLPERPTGHRANTIQFPTLNTAKLRVVFTPEKDSSIGLTEIEAWGHADLPLKEPTSAIDNLAYNKSGRGFPKASASYTSPFDKIIEINDGKSFFTVNSRNRWTAYKSPNKSDWIEIDFGEPKSVSRADIHIWGDNGGVRAPKSIVVQYWTGQDWHEVMQPRSDPQMPLAMSVNTVRFTQVSTSKIRVVFEHDLPGFSGVTELMLWEK
jgi:hypothetical protein